MYNYYEVVEAINQLQTYIQSYIFPVLIVLTFLNGLFITLSILRWYYK